MYHSLVYQPLLNTLVFVYNNVGDLGLAIILVTILIRLILYPLFHKSAKHQAVMQGLQPKIKEIQKEHKEDKAKQSAALMDLFKEHKINPFAGFLLLLVQLPILFALYRIFLDILKPETFGYLYSFVVVPAGIEPTLFGLIDLSKSAILDKHNISLVVLAGIAQYIQGRMSLAPKTTGGSGQAEDIGRRMVLIMPVVTVAIFYSLPAAISLYWLTTTVFSVVQQIFINKEVKNGKLGIISEKSSR